MCIEGAILCVLRGYTVCIEGAILCVLRGLYCV